MGIYLNPSNTDFQRALNSEIYVDKTELVKYTNSKLFTEQQFICVIRPRRFGKSMTANMLTAYYSKGCNSKELFKNLKISQDTEFEKHLNKYNVIRLDIQKFATRTKTVDEMLKLIEKRVLSELKEEYDIALDDEDMIFSIEQVFNKFSQQFVFIIDEWDCVLRDNKNSEVDKKQYLNFLCALFKGQNYISLAYITGILPIKKCGGQSEINSFYEYTMIDASPITEFTGFTENEVKELCDNHNMPFDEMKRWYNGYNVDGMAIYNPKSVVESIVRRKFNNYWTLTETYELLKVHIMSNFDDLRNMVAQLIAGEKITVNIGKFQNDMASINNADDVLTLLIHLGYLTYDFNKKTAWIPNSEVQQEFINSIEDGGWEEIMQFITQSEKLLRATIKGDEEKVAEMIEESHRSNASILKYNDENSLSCVLSLAYYSARKNYGIHREMPGGEGFADLVFIPRRNCSDPAMIIELKFNESAESALQQIKDRKYFECLKNYTGEILLVGISYYKDKNENKKHHVCKIEKIVK